MPVFMDVKEFPVPEHQADAVLNQANPISGTKYTVLPTTKNVRIITIATKVTWTVQPSPLELHIIIDGVNIPISQIDPVSDTWYNAELVDSWTPSAGFSTAHHPHRSFLLEGRSVKVEVEITGGTVSNLNSIVKYAKW